MARLSSNRFLPREEAILKRRIRYSGQIDGEHHEREFLSIRNPKIRHTYIRKWITYFTHLRFALRYPVDVQGEGKELRRREEEERVHEAEEADAAQVRGRVVALESNPLPVRSVPELYGFCKFHNFLWPKR